MREKVGAHVLTMRLTTHSSSKQNFIWLLSVPADKVAGFVSICNSHVPGIIQGDYLDKYLDVL